MDADVGASGSSGDKWDPTRQMQELTLLLYRFYLDMHRGMNEFLRAYGLGGTEAEAQEAPVQALPYSFFSATERDGALRELEEGIQELKIHHAALLEGYHHATQEGSRRILDSVDPERLRGEFEGSKVRVGPLKLDCRWPPLLNQAIWEEMLHRFQQYRVLDPADFERFFRDGFRAGYRRFRETRMPQSALPAEDER